MNRKPTTILLALWLAITCGSSLVGERRALACEDALGVQAVAAQSTPARPPRAPRAPQAPQTPAPPEAAETPEPAEAPELPPAPAIMAPRGWFGFGFQCNECYVRTGPGDSTVVWEFGSLPKIYSVDLGGPAARAGIRRGDVIVRIDGHSILSPEGGRRFGATRPGQVVKWTVQRDGQTHVVAARAAERPEKRERREREIVDLRRELEKLNDLQSFEEMRRRIGEISREIARQRRVQDETREQLRAKETTNRRLRYAGVIGGTEVEVRGPGSVIVSESDLKDQLVINTGESVVLIRVADYVRKRKGAGADPEDKK